MSTTDKDLLQEFENFVDTVDNVVFVCFKAEDLKKIGLEILAKDGKIVSRYYFGEPKNK